MKAAAYHRNGEPNVLAYQDVADPEFGPATVLIRVAHAALQGGDLLNRRGTPPPGDAPHVVGYQAAGVVEAVGAEVTDLRPGDRVAGFALAMRYSASLDTSQRALKLTSPKGSRSNAGSIGTNG